MVEITESISGSSEWFLNNNSNNNHNHNSNNHHNNSNTNSNINNNTNNTNNNTNNNNNGTFLSPLPVLNTSGVVNNNVLNKSIEWLYGGPTDHSMNTSSNKITKLSNGFSILQDGTQSPSCFLNLSSTSGNHDDPVQVPMNNANDNLLYQYNISPQLQSQNHINNNNNNNNNNNLNQQQQQNIQQIQLNGSNGSSNGYSSPISPVPQYSSNNTHSSSNSSSAGSSPIQEYPYFSPSSSPERNDSSNSPIQTIPSTKLPINHTFPFSSLKSATGIAPPQQQSTTTTTDFNLIYNYVQQSYTVKPEDSLLNQIQTSLNNSNNTNNNTQPIVIQNPFLPYTSTPITVLSSASSSTNSSPNNNNIIHYNNPNSNNNNQINNPIMELDEDKPFDNNKFLSHLKSIVPSFNENFDASSESSAHSESSQESDYDQGGDRNGNSNKKRGREDIIDTSGQTILSREQVLKLSSKEIEEYVSRLKMNHVLTQAEEKELKKQRRLVKNREYASQSRSRRKVYVENIESKLQKTNQDCASIKSQLNSVKEENKALKKQLYSLTNTLKSNPSLAEAFGKIFTPIGNNKTSSATLFVFFFLFTFTFLFQNPFSSTPLTFNSDRASSIQRNLLSLEDNNIALSQEWNIKKAILEETKQYVDSLLSSVYTANPKLKVLSETPLDTSSYMSTTTTTSKNNESASTSSVEVSEEISNVLSTLSVSDKESEKKNNNNNDDNVCKGSPLKCDSPPLSPLVE